MVAIQLVSSIWIFIASLIECCALIFEKFCISGFVDWNCIDMNFVGGTSQCETLYTGQKVISFKFSSLPSLQVVWYISDLISQTHEYLKVMLLKCLCLDYKLCLTFCESVGWSFDLHVFVTSIFELGWHIDDIFGFVMKDFGISWVFLTFKDWLIANKLWKRMALVFWFWSKM